MITCLLCNKEYSSRRCFSLHLAITEKSHFSSQLEREKFLVDTLYGNDIVEKTIEDYNNGILCCNDLTRTGPDIVKYITLLGIKRTSSDERKTVRYKEKYQNSILAKYGVTNISKSSIVQKKKEHTIEKKYGSYDDYLTKHREFMATGYTEYTNNVDRKNLQKRKYEATCLKKYGYKNSSQDTNVRNKMSASQLLVVRDMSYEDRLTRTKNARMAVCSRGGYESKPERKIQHALVDLNVGFRKHSALWNYNFDIEILDSKILIEVQGDMWHGNPSKYKSSDIIMGKLLVADIWKKDERKKKIAEANGYRLIYMWECDIVKKTDTELIEFVRHKLTESGYECCN